MRAILKLLAVTAAIVVLLAIPAFAGAMAKPDEGGFTISDYDVHAVISENNAYSITETIRVHFTEARHGITRDIPVNSVMTRTSSADGKEYTTKVQSSVSGIKVEGYRYSASNEGEYIRIKIGDPNKTVTGDQTYRISYKLKFGNDGVQQFDEVYYNIIGPDWDTNIDHATFSVELPKAFDAHAVGFSVGPRGAKGYNADELKFNVDGNTITGSVTKLGYYSGITLRVELPQGYFRVPDLRLPDWLIMGAIGLMSLVSILLFLLFGIDYKPVQTVEFNAPVGMTPAEVGYIFNGSVDSRDVVSLILYWADKGYLKIEDAGDDDYKLTKLKDLGGDAKDFEKLMFTKLFKKGDTVETDDLENSFYKTVSSVETKIQDSFSSDDRRLFTKASMRSKPWLGFLTILPMLLTMYLSLYRDLPVVVFAIMMGVLIGLALLLPVFLIIHVMRGWKRQSPTARRVKLLISFVLWIGAMVGFLCLTVDKVYSPLPLVAVLGTNIIALCAVFISKRTKQSAEWYTKILSFRDFIVLAERDKLVALVEQNPGYFYNVLPYAYVLNVTDKWAKNFESIAISPPEWYNGMRTVFSPSSFATSMSASMNSMHSSMTSAPSSGGSGGGGSSFSGGSSSGGGGGGGGGGSW